MFLLIEETNSVLPKHFQIQHKEIHINFSKFHFQFAFSLYNFQRHRELKHNLKIDKEVFDLMNRQVADDLIHLLSHEYIYYLPQFNHLYDGAKEILDYLYPNYNLHIITNGFQSVQDGKMKNSDLLKYFKTITNSESAGVKKPNPTIFSHAIQLANAEKEKSLMIGDSWEADIEGALNFGMDAIFFNEFNVPVENNFPQVNHLLDLKNYL